MKKKTKPKPKSRMPAAWRVDYKAAVARATRLQADNILLRQQAASVRHELKVAQTNEAELKSVMERIACLTPESCVLEPAPLYNAAREALWIIYGDARVKPAPEKPA